ncbi:hypothetical protein SORBI_3001G324200 [Sorghum bicolor]|uniref:Uncharacterized protein n=1 Tax=Sorghum bicolor TaxID=4558 RepID=A0A1B6QMB4_SORBI|nr:hypothetical protein SORBI_3001G324200 [Sorghum bicolor]
MGASAPHGALAARAPAPRRREVPTAPLGCHGPSCLLCSFACLVACLLLVSVFSLASLVSLEFEVGEWELGQACY